MELTTQVLESIAKNPNFQDKELLQNLALLFQEKPEAAEFLVLYGEYCEVMDDLVDEGSTPERVEKMSFLRMQIGKHPYWLTHSNYLWCVDHLIHNTYFDSVQWEFSDVEWHRRDAKVLSHCGYNMLFAIILIEFGDAVLKRFSLRFREHAHSRHLNDPI